MTRFAYLGVFAVLGWGCAAEPIPDCELVLREFQTADAQISSYAILKATSARARLAEMPEVGFVSAMASSYNRASIAPDEAGWFANRDRGHFIRQDGDEYVMAEGEGPGVITRLWSANPSGTLRIYVDGGATPVLEAPLRTWLSDTSLPLTGIGAHGFVSYFPIAFRDGFRVTSTASDLFYQVHYQQVPTTAHVETFRVPSADERYCFSVLVASPETLEQPATRTEQLGSGEMLELTASTEGSAIAELRLNTSGATPEQLRATLLRIAFDDEPCVWVPLGDFFGGGPHLGTAIDSAMTWVSGERRAAYWVMPFERVASIAIEGEAQVTLEVDVVPYPWTERSMHFHSQWRAPTSFDVSEVQDWPICEVMGSGVYVGTVLNVTNPVHGWWGEGDERIWVDGEDFPSEFGTGTEDYFGYAYCSTQLYSDRYSGQPLTGSPFNAGRASMYRWRQLDPVIFRRQLAVDFEVLHWGSEATAELTLDAINYWYALPDSLTLLDNPARAEFVIPPLPDSIADAQGNQGYRCY